MLVVVGGCCCCWHVVGNMPLEPTVPQPASILDCYTIRMYTYSMLLLPLLLDHACMYGIPFPPIFRACSICASQMLPVLLFTLCPGLTVLLHRGWLTRHAIRGHGPLGGGSHQGRR